MSAQASSSLRVPYDLRQAKQVERRMLIDLFQRLQAVGFHIRDYQYTGFGGIFFVDFIMMHRYLGLTRFLSVERDRSIERRVEFNRPYANIEIRIDEAGKIIPTLDPDIQHILWLDYDYHLDRSIVEDLGLAAISLSPGSILVVTVDVESPREREKLQKAMAYYEEIAKEFFSFGWTEVNFTPSELAHTNSQILCNVIRNAISARLNVEFIPLLNCQYRNGHHMVTVGGMIGTDVHSRMISACDFADAPYIRRSTSQRPYDIVVPVVSRSERLFLDHHMPADETWRPSEFELDTDDLVKYREIYRYLPAFAELLL